jgi:CheY-like chemotaxis protein
MAKVLLVEDEPLVNRMYEKALRFEGHEVDVVEDGEAALAKVASSKPDLILLDIMMPKMDGFAVLARLKENKSYRNIPVVVLTNLAGDEDTKKALSLGAVSYLVKSDLEPSKIVAEIEKSLK